MQSRFLVKILSALVLSGLSLTASCTKDPNQTKLQYVPDMADTAALKSQRDYLQPPEGSVARMAVIYPGSIEESEKFLANPIPKNEYTIQRGQKLWNTYCIPCHGAAGDSNGSITDVYPKPPNLVAKDYPEHKDGFFFHKITFGGAIMPGYGHSISPEERWQIVHYIHELQKVAK